jgi:hypothetical protein
MEIILQIPILFNDVNREFNTFTFTIVIIEMKEIEMEETCRMHGTENKYLKFSEVKSSGIALLASSYMP